MWEGLQPGAVSGPGAAGQEGSGWGLSCGGETTGGRTTMGTQRCVEVSSWTSAAIRSSVSSGGSQTWDAFL